MSKGKIITVRDIPITITDEDIDDYISLTDMANDSIAANFEPIFATYSPETVRKVM